VDELRAGARVHLVGIGGAGMSALARVLLERGHPVTGSDLRGGPERLALQAMGATVALGHDPAQVQGVDLVVYSNAVPTSNVEVRRAFDLGVPVVKRPELLELLMAGSRRILIAGTHGKTTTTAMTTVALQAAGADPSFAVGGTLTDAGTSAHAGSGDVFVAEADEAFRSFLALTGDCCVVTNLELDHHDEYADLAALEAAFVEFLDRRADDGLTLLCADDRGALGLAGRVPGPLRTYGTGDEAQVRIVDVRAEPATTRFRLIDDGVDLGPFVVRVPGLHNVRNAAAAVAAARWTGADTDSLREGIASFGGAQRRFQRLGTAGGVTVVDDYAHHPTELRATIAAARQTEPAGRVVAAFQPHRYSRTAALGPEMGAALADADLVVVTDVYAAGEAPIPGVTGGLIADAARGAGAEVHRVDTAGDLPDVLVELVRPGDVVLTLGAGDITTAGPVLLRLLVDAADSPPGFPWLTG